MSASPDGTPRHGGVILLVALLPLTATCARAEAPPVDPIRLAITIDDLPWVGPLSEGDSANDVVLRIAATLRVHEAPATGFVVCDRAAEDEQPVATWAAWGLSLGNHSAAHRDLNHTPVDVWLRDVEHCDRFLRRFGTAKTPYFRFPLLHQGDTAEKRERVRDRLASLGLETAHVTVDTSDWILTLAHAAALRTGDAVLRRDVGRDFLRHVVAAVEHADAVARRKLGRRMPQVLLLHANTLVADQLDALLLALRARGVELVSLERALADPVYDRPDDYVGGKGLSWLYRMRPVSIGDVEWDDAEATAIRKSFAAALDDDMDPQEASPVSHRSLSPEAPRGLTDILTDAGASERMRSLLVMHRGELMAEAYYHGAGPETAANLKSITKTLTSALVGVALREGWIEGVDDSLAKYLPERFRPGVDAAKAGITLRHLLIMSTGLAPVDYGAVQQSDNWVAAVLGRPMDRDARGETFAYDTPVLQLLTAALEKTAGMPVAELAQNELLGPLGAELVYWRPDAQGIALGGNDAYLRPRDLLRLGELYRRGGELGGHRLLPEAFVDASTSLQITPAERRVNHDTLPVRGYGFLWWLLDLDGGEAYAALGHGGQILLVSPREELVVVMTSRWPGPSSPEHYRHMTRILVERLLPLFGRPR